MRNTVEMLLLLLCLVAVTAIDDIADYVDEEDTEDTGDGAEPIQYIEVGIDINPETGTETETQTTPPQTENYANMTGHRIVGGRQISIEEAPWQVALLVNNVIHCGGSLISVLWVLTAAHCITKLQPDLVYARAGSDYFKRGGQMRQAALLIVHGNYSPNNSNNDIGMVRLRRRFSTSLRIKPIRLPRRSTRIPNHFIISGWGTTGETSTNPTVRLRGTTTNLVSLKLCAALYAGQNVITKNMLCTSAPGRDTCQGDSGGGLVNGGVIYGVVSFGIGCARSRYPGVYTNVRVELAWIHTVVRNFNKRLQKNRVK